MKSCYFLRGCNVKGRTCSHLETNLVRIVALRQAFSTSIIFRESTYLYNTCTRIVVDS